MKPFTLKHAFSSRALPLATCILLAACGGGGGSSSSNNSNNNSNNNAVAEQYQGNWKAEGYGLAFKVDADSIELYQYTSNNCFLEEHFEDITTQEVERSLRLNNDGDIEWYSQVGSANFGAPAVSFASAEALPTSCTDGLEPTIGDSNYQDSALNVFDVFREIFTEYFVDVEQVSDAWQSMADELRYALPDGPGDVQLIEAMNVLIHELSDTHNFVDLGNGQTLRAFSNPTFLDQLIAEFAQLIGVQLPLDTSELTHQQIEDINSYISSEFELTQAITLNYAEQESDIKQSDNGLITWFENDGVGYLNISAMTGFGDENAADDLASTESAIANLDAILDEALADLANVSAMIVDVRMNDGGHDYISLAIASRFTDDSVHAYSKQARLGTGRTPLIDVFISPRGEYRFTGPTFLLVSRNTVSAAEVFSLSMSALDNVTLVGEPTQGAFSDVLGWTLPNGFELGLSNEFYLTPEGQWLEGEGVPVDIEVPTFSLEARTNFADEAIETVVSLLTDD